MGRLVEGLWDCPYCGQSGIRGGLRECPNCGKERNENVKFYLGDPHAYVPKDQENKISREPDWVCAYCGAHNPATTSDCKECGHDKDGGDKTYFEKRKEIDDYNRKMEADERGYSSRSSLDYGISSENARSGNYYNQKKQGGNKLAKKSGFLKFTGIGLAIFAVIWLMCFLFIPKEAEMTITDITWEYQLRIEEYRTVNESDWSLPPGGRLQYSQSEIHHYVDVLDHYETKTRTYTEQVLSHYETVVTGHRDLGNGYFEEITSQQPVYKTETKTETYQEPVYRTEPVFQTKYYYEIDKWMYDRTITSSGHDKNTYYGEYVLAEKEREGSRSQDYEFTGVTNEDTYTFDVSKEEWDTYDVGDIITVKINNLGMVSIVEEN